MLQGAVNHALQKIYLTIPPEILNEAFQPSRERRSLDGIIKEKILAKIVLPSCNLYSGKIKKIKLLIDYAVTTDHLGGIFPMTYSNYSYFKIPKSVTENRKILYVLDIGYPLEAYASYGYLQNMGGNTIPSMTDQALSSFTESPQYMVPTPIIMDDNILRLDPPQAFYSEWILSCLLEYDNNFTNVYPHMYEPIADLMRYATEAYIYNDLVMKVDHAELVGGKTLGMFKTIIDSYSGSYEKFQEALKVFRGEAIYDKESLQDLIALMIP